MTSLTAGFFSRDEVLGGLPARRASTLVFAIQTRTLQQVVRSRRAMATYLTERTSADQERAFLDALSGGRDLPFTPSIQDLERYAGDWAYLVPDDPDLRAAVAARLGAAYQIPAGGAPRLVAALGLDTTPVRAAFERLNGRPVDSLFVSRVPLRARLAWARSRAAAWLESLPPTATAFALTLTETVGAGILALPIALAAVGPIAGIVILVVFGLVNMLTVAALVEAITRSGSMRHGSAYFGHLVNEYLGRPGAFVLGPALAILDIVSLVALLIGFGTTLGSASGLPSALFAAALFGLIVLIIRRESIDATVAFALFVGTVNVTLIVAISLIALTHLRVENLAAPALGGGVAATGGLIFGTVLASYFGHTSAGNAAKVVLDRDPTGRALFVGNLAAMAVVIALYCLAIVAIGGAVPSERLVGFSGTALVPLAVVAGPAVAILGSIYVVLSMGIGAISLALGLANQVAELMPERAAAGRVAGLDLADEGTRFVLRALPVLLLFPVLEWLLINDLGSFTEPIAILGAIATPLLGGAFPVLLLLAARRRGEYAPSTIIRFLGHPITVGTLFTLYVAAILTNGLFVGGSPFTQVTSIVIGGTMVVVLVLVIRRGSFHPRAVLELRRDERAGGQGIVSLIVAGRPFARPIRLDLEGGTRTVDAAAARFERFADLRSAEVDLRGVPTWELEVWAHDVTRDGESVPIPFEVHMNVEHGVGSEEPSEDPQPGPPPLAAEHGRKTISVTPLTMSARIIPRRHLRGRS